MIEYAVLKLIHIGALVFWLGPALGAWFVLRAVEHPVDYSDATAARVSRVFFLTIIIEHIAFTVLLASGFTLAYRYHFFGAEWLQQKLLIVLLAIVPLEIVDVLLGNWIASAAAKKRYQGIPLRPWESAGLAFYHGLFTKIALFVIPLSVIAVMYLAIAKTGFPQLY